MSLTNTNGHLPWHGWESRFPPDLASREDRLCTTGWAGQLPSSLHCCYTWSISCRSLVGVMSVVILASLPCVGSTEGLDIHSFLQSPLSNPAWCLALVLEPGFMLGCVPLGPVSGLHPGEEMLLLWVQGSTVELFYLVCAYFPELQEWERFAGKLPPASGTVQLADGVVS